eukprot:CAMPEP_0113933550 /NCGR_PEP_ID=MMETSP1339-20121228/615_1 /TAXON_ID=94617 /ORGANISM="Fibrocapsa japonica" /LENGTH=342 /DNA_ID=CAMNT_0000934857 /DNA_START=152 /DNA_END=1181 /DNA_ORIENTATION=+ /assembly_acc=CAM_ASM_000762
MSTQQAQDINTSEKSLNRTEISWKDKWMNGKRDKDYLYLRQSGKHLVPNIESGREYLVDCAEGAPGGGGEGGQDSKKCTVWECMRREAQEQAQAEPLLVSFLYSTILNHDSLESSLAFHMANKLQSPSLISTEVQRLFQEALADCPDFRLALRLDIQAVRERDPACTSLIDAMLYFKGFQALQSHRLAHHLWKTGRRTLAHYLQSQVSSTFQIDIHPGATLGSGLFIDHGTGIVVGETAVIGHNVSMLHQVTLGGSGTSQTVRHPQIGNGVLIGAGSSILGNIVVGDGAQIGACSLVLEDIPPACVAVGVPARILGVGQIAQPSLQMRHQSILDSGVGGDGI